MSAIALIVVPVESVPICHSLAAALYFNTLLSTAPVVSTSVSAANVLELDTEPGFHLELAASQTSACPLVGPTVTVSTSVILLIVDKFGITGGVYVNTPVAEA